MTKAKRRPILDEHGAHEYVVSEWCAVAAVLRGGTGACLAAYVDWVEAGWSDQTELAMIVALIRSVDWRTGKTRDPYCPSVALLARRAGMSTRTAHRALAKLIDARLVVRTKRGRSTGGKAPSAYELYVPVLQYEGDDDAE